MAHPLTHPSSPLEKDMRLIEGQEASCLQASHSSISRYEDGYGQVDLEGDDRATNCDWQYVMDEVR